VTPLEAASVSLDEDAPIRQFAPVAQPRVTPLEAAREILDTGLLAGDRDDNYRDQVICAGCGARQEWERDFPHAGNCPVRALPRIVAALEAAEAYLAPGAEGGGSLARLQALEAALRGEVMP
jgi:hypothetical protein